MRTELYLTFILATTILMLIPGPNVALIIANSIAHGTRYGLLTVAGTSSAMIIQLFLTALGLTELLGNLAHLFEWIRWAGVAYLLYLGFRQWTAKPLDLSQQKPQRKSIRAIYLRGFLISLTNPKTLLFFSAFFPQFVTPDHHNIASQILLLSATFLLLAVVLDSTWAIGAGRLRGLLAKHGKLRNRLSGGMLIGSGTGLAFAGRR
jgi:threonine/homoserine/homoserine lactone efflux protein